MPDRLSPNDTERLSKHRKKRPSLTYEQRQRLRAVLRNLRHQHGSWKRVAEVTGVNVNTLYGIVKSTDFGSINVLVLVARAARIPVDHMLDGTMCAADVCRYCGQPLPKK